MGYGAPRVVYKKAGIKNMNAPTSPVKFAKEEVKPIEVPTIPETVEDQDMIIPTTFVKKSGPKGDVNKYVKKEDTE